MSFEAGRVLKERYKLVRPLGQGSQAAVWVAEHLALQTLVAVKLIDPDLAKREDARERFKREATAAAQLRSQHVVQILDHGIDEDQPFIVMELLEGEDLYERLEKRKRLSLRETSKIITQIARALARAHAAGIIHRDLKPENVYLVSNEDDEIVKVLDFGVAKIQDPAKATKQTGVGTLIGTPHYMSSEQVKGTHDIDHRSDLWAVGVIAYQCLTGELPFDSNGVGDLLIKISIGEIPVPSKLVPDLPKVFDAWFAKACERDVTKRFQSARELAMALATIVGSSGITGRPPAMAPRPEGQSRPPPKPSTFPAKRAEAETELDTADLEEVLEEAPNEAIIRPLELPRELDVDWDPEPPPPLQVVAPREADRGSNVALPLSRRKTDQVPPAPPSRPAIAPPPDSSPSLEAAPPSRSAIPAPIASSPVSQRISPVDPVIAQAPPPAPPSSQRGVSAAAVVVDRAPPSTTVSGVARPGFVEDAPPELDGSRRKRLGSYLALGLVAAIALVAWQVVRSQLPPTPRQTAAPPTVAAPEPAQTPVVVPEPQPMVSAVDPGQLKHPPKPDKPTPSVKAPAPGPRPAPKPRDDGSVEIFTPPSE